MKLHLHLHLRLHLLLALPVLLGSSQAAHAQTLKPGLWEASGKMPGGGGNQMDALQGELAKMPPEQRKMMQDMLAKKNATLGAAGPGSVSRKICLTQDMIARNQLSRTEDDCTTTMSPRVGNTMKMAFTCSKSPSSGEGQITYVSSEAYTIKMTISSAIKGKGEKMDMEQSGKWLGTDCGSVQPIATPKK